MGIQYTGRGIANTMAISRQSSEIASVDVVLSADTAGFRIELSGEIDMASRPQLDDAAAEITAHPPVDIVVDLTAVSFLGSDGLGFLAQLRNHVVASGHGVTLEGPNRAALRALQITGFDKVFTITGVTG
jgi:anti-sigma B factor antagonist